MSTEYDGLDIEQLFAITEGYRTESMQDQANGWGSAWTVLRQLRENLQEHQATIEGKWTSKSSGPYMQQIRVALEIIQRAEEHAYQASEGWYNMAQTASDAKEKVAEEHQKWQEEKGKPQGGGGGGNPLLDFFASSSMMGGSTTGGLPSVLSWNKEEPPTEGERRKPFDQAARKLMNTALQSHMDEAPKVTRPVIPYEPTPLPRDKQWMGGNDWGENGTGGSNGADTAGLSAASYGGNAVGGSHGPTLQSGAPTPTAPAPSGGGPAPIGTPSPGGGPAPVGGIPVGAAGAKGVTPPARATPTAGSPRSGASRTPGLPSNNRATTSRPGTVPGRGTPGGAGNRANPNGRGATQGRAGAPNGRGGRGLQKSRMAPTDRTGRVRSSGEVMGRRNSAKPAAKTTPQQRQSPQNRTTRPVLQGAKTRAANQKQAPTDRTKQGYTNRVLGARPRTEFSRTPIVAHKLDHASGQKILGQRVPETEETQARNVIAARKQRRRALLEEADAGLARPVIDNGISHTAQLDEAKPSAAEPVKTPDSLWQLDERHVISGVIGQRRPMPEVDHDPGPGVFTGRGEEAPAPQSDPASHQPGPTAFNGRTHPDTTNWP